MESQELSFMLKFIQEVANFKSFIYGYQSSGSTTLLGLGEMHLFKFYMDSDNWLVMRLRIRNHLLMHIGYSSIDPPI